MSDSRERVLELRACLMLLGLALIFAWPILRHIDYWGVEDWDQHAAWAASARESVVVHHEWPFWDPYRGGGFPALGHPQSMCFSPFFLFVLAFGPVIGLKLAAIANLMLGLCGAYCLARHWRCNRSGSVIAALVYMFSSHTALIIATGETEYFDEGWLPWILLAVNHALEKPERRLRYTLLAAIAFTLAWFQGGVIHVFFNFLAILVLVCAHAISTRSLAALRVPVMLVLTVAGLSACRTLPMLETLPHMPRPTEVTAFQPETWRILPAAFLGRDQAVRSADRDVRLGFPAGELWSWEEYGCYVGLPALCLAVAGLFTFRGRRLTLTLAALLFLILYLGHLSPIDLWAGLHRLPFIRSLEIPSRGVYVLALLVGLAAAGGWSWAIKRLGTSPWTRVLAIGMPAIILLDTCSIAWPILANSYPNPPPTIERQDTFMQIADSADWERNNYFYQAQNIGNVDAYAVMLPYRSALPRGSDLYRGEAYLGDPSAGSVRIEHRTGNTIQLKVDAMKDVSVVVNQNFLPGWTVQGVPSTAVRPHQGKIAVTTPSGSWTLQLAYRPTRFNLGLIVSMLTLLAAAFAIAGFKGVPTAYVVAAAGFVVFAYALAGRHDPEPGHAIDRYPHSVLANWEALRAADDAVRAIYANRIRALRPQLGNESDLEAALQRWLTATH